jgi:endonuclease III
MAARKKSSRNRGNPNNPNTVLVLFMVFFILVSIGTGVTTYYGYAGQKKLEEDATSARKEAKAARNALEYWKFQALFARAAQGPLVKDDNTDEYNDLGVYAEGFKDGSKFKDEKTRPAIEELVKKTEGELGWNAAEKKFATTWAKKFEKLDADLKKVQSDYGTLVVEKKAVDEKLQGLQTKYETNWTKLKESIDKGNGDALAASKARTAEMDKAMVMIQEQQAKNEKTEETLQKMVKTKDRILNEKNTAVAELTEKITALESRAKELEAAANVVSATLMVGDFAGKWTGTLARGGEVKLEVKADGSTIWSVPGVGRDAISGVSRLEKSGENYVVNIQNQPVRLYLATDRQTLRLQGGNMDSSLTRK